jgi:hypothetical protein
VNIFCPLRPRRNPRKNPAKEEPLKHLESSQDAQIQGYNAKTVNLVAKKEKQ